MMASAALFAGCQDPNEVTGEAKVTLDPETLIFPEEESTLTFSVTATRDWSVKNTADWITAIEPSEGVASNKPQTVTIKVAANEGRDRHAEIKVRAGVASATLKIIQNGQLGEIKPIEAGDGTKEHPYSASQAHQIAVELGSGNTATSPVFIKGMIHKLAAKHTDDQIKEFGNGSFYISDNGESSETDFYCYQVNYLGNTAFTSADQVKVGDEVMVYGTITNYNGTCETTGKGAAYIVELNGEFNDGQSGIMNAESKTVAEFIAAANKTTYYKLTGTVSSYKFGNYMTFDLTDATGKIYVYQVANEAEWKDKIKDGDIVTLAGKYDIYNGTHEVKAAQILSVNTYEGQDITASTVADVLAAKDGDHITLNNALVVATSPVGYLVTDSEGKDFVLTFFKDAKADTAPAAAVGDIVNIKADKASYADMPQLLNPETTVVSSGNEVARPAAEDITAGFDSFSSTKVKYVSFTGSLKIDGSYFNVNVNGASTNVGAFVAPSFDVASLSGVAGVVYTGYYIYKTGGKYIYLMLTSAGMPDGPYFIVSPTTAKVAAAGGEVEINVTSNVAWTASSDNAAFTVDNASGEGNGKVKVTVAENTAFEGRSATITIATTEDVTTKSYSVAISQAAAIDPDANFIELTREQIIEALTAKINENGFASKYQDFSFTAGGYIWSGKSNISKDKSGNLSTPYLQIRNTDNSHILTPEFASEISKIEVTGYAAVSGSSSPSRKLYAVPVNTDLSTATTDEKYGDAVVANAYGFATFTGGANVELTETIDVSAANVKQVKIVSKDGALYLIGIKVYLK